MRKKIRSQWPVLGVIGYSIPQDSILQNMLFHSKKRPPFEATHMESGDDLLFQAVTSQVPLTRRGLTAVIGMGTGGTLLP